MEKLSPSYHFNRIVNNKIQRAEFNYQIFRFLVRLDTGLPLPQEERIIKYNQAKHQFYKEETTQQIIRIVAFIFPFFYIIISYIIIYFYFKNFAFYSLLNILYLLFYFIIIFAIIYLNNLSFNLYKKHYIIPLLIDTIILTMNYVFLLRKENILKNRSNKSIDNIENHIKTGYEDNLEVFYYLSKNMIEEIYLRKNTLQALEVSAVFFEKYLPQALHTGELATDESFKQSMSFSANALRDKKKWVLMPKEDTYNVLTTYLLDTLTCIVNGNWDALESLELGKDIQKSTRMHKIINASIKLCRVVFFSLLPLIGFLLLQLSPLAIKEPSSDVIIRWLLLWTGATFLIRYDPDTSAKFSLIKDTKDLLTFK